MYAYLSNAHVTHDIRPHAHKYMNERKREKKIVTQNKQQKKKISISMTIENTHTHTDRQITFEIEFKLYS